MIARSLVVVLAAAAALSCGGPPPPEEERSELAEILPEASELAGWTVVDGPAEHDSDTLFEYLNGGAERYLANGFRGLVHVRYQLGSDPAACVTLDVYDMGSDLGAFGIYSAARRPEYEARGWGSEGYRSGAVAAAWKGAIFVHGEADDEREELTAMLEALVAAACERAPGEASAPAVLELLPVEGRVPRSERYVPADLLGHSFLPGGALATYEVDGGRAELYLSELASDQAAATALDGLRARFADWGTVGQAPPALGAGAFRYSDPALGEGTAVRVGGSVAGIHGDIGPEAREEILKAVVDRLG